MSLLSVNGSKSNRWSKSNDQPTHVSTYHIQGCHHQVFFYDTYIVAQDLPDAPTCFQDRLRPQQMASKRAPRPHQDCPKRLKDRHTRLQNKTLSSWHMHRHTHNATTKYRQSLFRTCPSRPRRDVNLDGLSHEVCEMLVGPRRVGSRVHLGVEVSPRCT